MKQKRNILEALNRNAFFKRSALFISFCASVFLVPFFVFAALIPLIPCGYGTAVPECKFCHIFQLIQNVYNFGVFYLIPPIAFAFVAVGGFLWFISGGSQTLAAKAIKILQAVLIGLVVAYASWLIVNFIIALIAKGIIIYEPAVWYKPTSWFVSEKCE